MKKLSDESFICQNCKTPLSRQRAQLWVTLGEIPHCQECGNDDFDMYPAQSDQEYSSRSIPLS